MPRTRKSRPPSLKARVAVEAIKAHKTTAQIARMFGVHPTQVGGWKEQALTGLPDVFGKVQFEFLKTHQHAAEFVPGDFPAVDDEKRRIAGSVPLNHSSHDPMGRDPVSKLAVLEMFSGIGAAQLFDPSPEQHQPILPGITDDLQPVASRTSAAKLKGIVTRSFRTDGHPSREKIR